MKQQLRATDDVVVSEYLRNGVDEPQNKPYHCLYEPIDSRKTCQAIAGIVHRHIDDECN